MGSRQPFLRAPTLLTSQDVRFNHLVICKGNTASLANATVFAPPCICGRKANGIFPDHRQNRNISAMESITCRHPPSKRPEPQGIINRKDAKNNRITQEPSMINQPASNTHPQTLPAHNHAQIPASCPLVLTPEIAKKQTRTQIDPIRPFQISLYPIKTNHLQNHPPPPNPRNLGSWGGHEPNPNPNKATAPKPHGLHLIQPKPQLPNPNTQTQSLPGMMVSQASQEKFRPTTLTRAAVTLSRRRPSNKYL